MKYLAVFVLSLASMLNAAASSNRVAPAPDALSITLRAAQTVPGDSLLMLGLGGALIALQLRRRQKSLRNPRLSI